MPVPLLAGDDDIRFDLQAAFTASYELLGYELLVNYTAPPEIPLNQTETRLASEYITIDETEHPLSDDGPDAGAGA